MRAQKQRLSQATMLGISKGYRGRSESKFRASGALVTFYVRMYLIAYAVSCMDIGPDLCQH